MRADRGAIEVTTADTKDLKIVVRREAKARNEEREKALLADHEVTFEQEGDKVVVKARLNRPMGGVNLSGRTLP